MRNLNEIFREDVTYDIIKNHRGFTLSSEDIFLEKPRRWGQIDLPPPSTAVLRLTPIP